ncbi:MAG: GC-type dockerin domain-anchored protein [Phycisphaerales bacterium JB064]
MAACCSPSYAQECEPEWVENLFLQPGVTGDVRDAVVWDDGRGAALYIAGEFFSAGGVSTALVARWDGQTWESLTSITGDQLLGDQVRALAVFDDGGGPELFAGGSFTRAGGLTASNIAKWDGRTWREVEGSLGEGVNGRVDCLHVHTDTTGTALYVGGQFSNAGGVSASNIAKWDGAEWSRLGRGIGAGVDAAVFTMETFDAGDGAALYVGGGFTSATGVATARYLARWDGVEWSSVGSGADGGVSALRTITEGDQDYLYIGGAFSAVGGVPASRIARYDGNDWRQVGEGLEGTSVQTILSFDDGQGPSIVVGGSLDEPGSRGEDAGILRWDGQTWKVLDGGVSPFVDVLAEFDGRLVVGGRFEWTRAGGRMNHVATWASDGWRSLGNGFSPDGPQAFATFNAGQGPVLHVGGNFSSVGGRPSPAIARWDGSKWLDPTPALRSSSFPSVSCMQVFDDGSGPTLFVGGNFDQAGNRAETLNVARWDGHRWHALGEGFNGSVHAFTIHDAGDGPRLYAGGEFTKSGNRDIERVAQWTGVRWEPIGSPGTPGPNGEVRALTAWNGDLYAGGRFTSAGGEPAANIARWDGAEWTPVGSGLNRQVNALATFEQDGSTFLFAGGEFFASGPVQVQGVARWDGTAWTNMDDGVDGEANALLVFDDGAGPGLYVAGPFGRVGPVDSRIPAAGLAEWTSGGWRGVTASVSGEILALAEYRTSARRSLMAGGRFRTIDGVMSAGIAELPVCPNPCPADLDGDGVLTVFDFLAFQSAFAMGAPEADFDFDGEFTLFDFLAFQSAFARGCP